MKRNYSLQTTRKEEDLVRAAGRDLSISAKQAIELCAYIRNKPVEWAKARLENTLKKQEAIPFKRFTNGAGHKRGIGPGKYPEKTARQFLKLLNTLEANAQNKGLSSRLIIIHACAQRASRPMRYGRKRGIAMKRAHVELAAEELIEKKPGQEKQKKKQAQEKQQEEKEVKAKPEQKQKQASEKQAPEKKPKEKKEQEKAKKIKEKDAQKNNQKRGSK